MGGDRRIGGEKRRGGVSYRDTQGPPMYII